MRRSLLVLVALLASNGSAAERRFTDTLVDENKVTWDSVINHKFTDQLAAGTLDLNILKCVRLQQRPTRDITPSFMCFHEC